MKSKKAIIEAQVTWVFILIVGVIILLFFFGIAQKQKQISDLKMSAALLNQLDGILTGAEVSAGTASLIPIPKIDIEIENCDSFSVGSATKSLKSRIVFSPDLIKGRQLIAYNLDWSVPYRVTNFLYLTSPEVRYIFINPPSDFYESLPEIMNKEIVTAPNDIDNKNNYKVKFVFLNSNTDSFLDIAKSWGAEISAINISNNKVSFYNGSEWSSELNCNDTASLIGAIFAEDAEQYKCAMKKADEKFKIVTEIHQRRLIKLNETLQEGTCKNLIENLINNFISLLDTDGKVQANEELQQYSCPTIY